MKISDLPFAVDFGNGGGFTWIQDGQGNAIGIIEGHFTPEGKRCEGIVFFDVPELTDQWRNSHTHMWKVESWNPLTISPSVLCKACGHHGWIRNGAWEKANDSPS